MISVLRSPSYSCNGEESIYYIHFFSSSSLDVINLYSCIVRETSLSLSLSLPLSFYLCQLTQYDVLVPSAMHMSRRGQYEQQFVSLLSQNVFDPKPISIKINTHTWDVHVSIPDKTHSQSKQQSNDHYEDYTKIEKIYIPKGDSFII